MFFNIEVNNKQIKARHGETILAALRRNGIDVPTLCHLQELTPTGACRICVVEVEGRTGLVTSCSQQVEEWMKIQTHSPRVLQARKTLIELILANHPADCLYCPKNGNCELQRLAWSLHIRERRFPGTRLPSRIDQTSPALVSEPAKCILCGRCVRVCGEITGVYALEFIRRGQQTAIATTGNKALNLSCCITCGQCIQVCSTAALREKDQITEIQEVLHDKAVFPVIHYSPAIAVSIAENLGFKPGKDMQGILNAILRTIGFRKVFDTSFAIDYLVNEQVELFLKRLQTKSGLPLISSCCPAWVKHAEQSLPDLLPLLAPLRSPQQIMGRLVKQYLCEQNNLQAHQIINCSLTPCTAKKFEAQRGEMRENGTADVDYVITTRELIRLINLNGIDVRRQEEEVPDPPFASGSSAARLYSTTGGVAEAFARALCYRLEGKEMSSPRINKLRSSKETKVFSFNAGGREFGVAAIQSFNLLMPLLEEIKNGKKHIQFIEVMACPGGCVNGGGQPLNGDREAWLQRMKTIYDLDDRDPVRVSGKNPALLSYYKNTRTAPGSDETVSICQTGFRERKGCDHGSL